MKAKTNLLAVAMSCVIVGAGCTPKESQSTETSQRQVERKLTDPDCTGHFVFDTANSGSGKSACRDGDGISYTAHSDAPVPSGLSCDYSVRYTSAKISSGYFFCSDGSEGELSVTDRPHGGTAQAEADDGRSFGFTFSY